MVKKARCCPICSTTEKVCLYKQNFNNDVISLMDSYDVVVCSNCGFAYADNIPRQSIFDNYYEVMSKYEFNYNDGVVSGDYIDYYTKIADFIAPYIADKNAAILDMGCSTGCLLSIFKSRGYSNLLGVDPSPSCVKTAKQLYNIEAVTGNINSLVDNEKFDLIILSAVLEHLVDYESSMQAVRSLLKDNGLLFIAVPDAERFGNFISAPFQQFSTEHISYFSQYSLKNMLSAFSFTILKIYQSESKLNMTTEPDIFVITQKSNEKSFSHVKDNTSELKLRDYIAKCTDIETEIKKIIKDKLAATDKVIVWGTGTHTQRLLSCGLDISKIQYFVDSNTRYTGKKLKGTEIKLPAAITEPEYPILISTYTYQKEIAHQIRNILKLKNEIITIYSEVG